MAETQTRGWVAEEVSRAQRVEAEVRHYGCPTLGDVMVLVSGVERLAAEVERLHGVIRDYQARVGEKAGGQ